MSEICDIYLMAILLEIVKIPITEICFEKTFLKLQPMFQGPMSKLQLLWDDYLQLEEEIEMLHWKNMLKSLWTSDAIWMTCKARPLHWD